MTADAYLNGILMREAVDTTHTSPVRRVMQTLSPVLVNWGGRYLWSVTPSGSFAKGTANRSGTDIDLFLSLIPETPETLRQVHDTLSVALTRAGYTPRQQDVSLGLRVDGLDVDLVPAKQQSATSQDHSLYRRKADSWTKTNVDKHIAHVNFYRRQQETRILKLWRIQNGLAFPSFYLELAVIEALKNCNESNLSTRVWISLKYLAEDFIATRFIDPANTNNIISDDLTVAEKSAIKNAAIRSTQAKVWGEIVR